MSTFFAEMTEASGVKATIVEKYFNAWSKIIVPRSRSGKVAYIDLFSGPGRYRNGDKSTPLKILELCIERPDLAKSVVAIFNDANPDFTAKLESEINNLAGIDKMKYRPSVLNGVVGEDLAKLFSSQDMLPTLSFVDPWGYKGLSQKLIQGLIKDWGSDIIFFFNYNRINAAITNGKVRDHIEALFTEERAQELEEKIQGLIPEEREPVIINELAEVIQSGYGQYVLPFRFVGTGGRKTSHYVIFSSKNSVGYKVMKEIMWACSTQKDDGVAGFCYEPVTDPQLSLLFSFSSPLEELGGKLLVAYEGKQMTVEEIFMAHNVGTPYVLANYKEVLRRLEAEGKIATIPPAAKRRKNTMGDTVLIKFP